MMVRERKFSSLLGGATTLDWNISARCVCDGASFSLDEFQVDLTPVVYLRRPDQYSSPGHAMEVRLKELEHVGDINAWSAGEKASAESYERFLRLQAYQSQAECESNNRDAMESFVRTGFYPAMMGSIYRWDLSRKHDVTEW